MSPEKRGAMAASDGARFVLGDLPLPSFVLDAEFGVRDANIEAQRLLNMSSYELGGHHLSEYFELTDEAHHHSEFVDDALRSAFAAPADGAVVLELRRRPMFGGSSFRLHIRRRSGDAASTAEGGGSGSETGAVYLAVAVALESGPHSHASYRRQPTAASLASAERPLSALSRSLADYKSSTAGLPGGGSSCAVGAGGIGGDTGVLHVPSQVRASNKAPLPSAVRTAPAPLDMPVNNGDFAVASSLPANMDAGARGLSRPPSNASKAYFFPHRYTVSPTSQAGLAHSYHESMSPSYVVPSPPPMIARRLDRDVPFAAGVVDSNTVIEATTLEADDGSESPRSSSSGASLVDMDAVSSYTTGVIYEARRKLGVDERPVLNVDDVHPDIEISSAGHVAIKHGEGLYRSVRMSTPIPMGKDVYFEFTWESEGSDDGNVCVGFSSREFPLNALVGSTENSVGFYSMGHLVVRGEWIPSKQHDIKVGSTFGCLVRLVQTGDDAIAASAAFFVDGVEVVPLRQVYEFDAFVDIYPTISLLSEGARVLCRGMPVDLRYGLQMLESYKGRGDLYSITDERLELANLKSISPLYIKQPAAGKS